jgi:hypothetical protein
LILMIFPELDKMQEVLAIAPTSDPGVSVQYVHQSIPPLFFPLLRKLLTNPQKSTQSTQPSSPARKPKKMRLSSPRMPLNQKICSMVKMHKLDSCIQVCIPYSINARKLTRTRIRHHASIPQRSYFRTVSKDPAASGFGFRVEREY